MNKIILIFIVIFISWASLSSAATYYVCDSDGEYGDEDGSSPANCFDGIADISGLSTGDTLYFCGDWDYNEGWPYTITVESLIVRGDCSSPANLDGGRTITSWTGPDGNGVYYFDNPDTTIAYNYLYEDGEFLTKATDATCADGNYFPNNTTDRHYYKPTTGVPGDHTLELGGNSAFSIDNVDGVTITEFHVTRLGNGLVVANTPTGSTVTNNTFTKMGEALVTYDDGVDGTITITGNTGTMQQNGFYFFAGGTGTFYIADNTLTYTNYNKRLNGDGHAVGVQKGHTGIIEDNYFSHCFSTIALWSDDATPAVDGVIIRRNFIGNNKGGANHTLVRDGSGIIFSQGVAEAVLNTMVNNNIIVNNVNGLYTLRATTTGANAIENNTFADNTYGIYAHTAANDINYYNNIFYNNDVHLNVTATPARLLGDYNKFYPNGSTQFVWNSVACDNFADWQSDSGEDANSGVMTTPGFVDAAIYDMNLTSQSDALDSCNKRPLHVAGYQSYNGRTRLYGAGCDVGAYEKWQGSYLKIGKLFMPISRTAAWYTP